MRPRKSRAPALENQQPDAASSSPASCSRCAETRMFRDAPFTFLRHFLTMLNHVGFVPSQSNARDLSPSSSVTCGRAWMSWLRSATIRIRSRDSSSKNCSYIPQQRVGNSAVHPVGSLQRIEKFSSRRVVRSPNQNSGSVGLL
jgi:hypothetical protein